MTPGPYLFLPDDRRYDPMYAMVDRHATVQFFNKNGCSRNLGLYIPVSIARQYGMFTPLRAIVDLNDVIRPRMRNKAVSKPTTRRAIERNGHATDAAYAQPKTRKGSRSSVRSSPTPTNRVPVPTAEWGFNAARVR